jgi:hypothetical protein
MRLQLADNNCTNCEKIAPLLPVRDPETGRIFNVNPLAFAQMTTAEQMRAKNEAPIILAKLVEGDGLGETGTPFRPLGIDALRQLQAFEQEQNKLIQQGALTPVNGQMMPQKTISPNMGVNPNFSVEIEPSAKPWFARTEVLVPVLIGGVLVTYLLFQRPQRR